MASDTKVNYHLKDLARDINHGHKCDATIGIINLASSFIIVLCL